GTYQASGAASAIYYPQSYTTLPSDGGVALGDAGCACGEDPHGFYAFLDYGAFRGISDGDWENNGINTGVNFGTTLGALSDWTGIGFQIGGSIMVSDFSGAGWRMDRTTQAETQGFLTYGFFRKPTESSRWTGSVVQDWMFANTFGLFAEDLTFT